MDLEKLVQDKQLTSTEHSVLEYIIAHLDQALDLGVRGIAKENFTSTSTIMRLSKKLGYTGFIDMYYKLVGMVDQSEGNYKLNQDFIHQFANDQTIDEHTYHYIRRLAKLLTEDKRNVFIYGMGFSSLMARYLAKKLLVLGVKVIFSDGSDSIGIFENNIDNIGMLILFSRSGQSKHVLNRAKTAKENNIVTACFTSDTENQLIDECDIVIKARDDNHFDDQNMKPTMFFTRTMLLIEVLIYEYYSVSIHQG